MNNWKRIAIVLVLIGSTALFYFWSTNQFKQVFNDLDSINIYSSYPTKQNTESNLISPEILGELAVSTESTTSTTDINTEAEASDTDIETISDNLEFSFTSPQKGEDVYIGCTYSVPWESSTIVGSLSVDLIDAGTRETMGPIASGLLKQNIIEEGLQDLKWKVGVVWPGVYYIKVSNINDVETVFRSEVFNINKISENISISEKENICKESGGSF